MKKLNFVFFIFFFTVLGCQAQQDDKANAKDPEKAVNLAESEGCGSEKSETDGDEVSFAQSSKLESQNSEDEIFNEEKKSDSGCTL